jgi:hypothetical protein
MNGRTKERKKLWIPSRFTEQQIGAKKPVETADSGNQQGFFVYNLLIFVDK